MFFWRNLDKRFPLLKKKNRLACSYSLLGKIGCIRAKINDFIMYGGGINFFKVASSLP